MSVDLKKAREAVVLLVEDNPAEQNLTQRALGRGVVSCDLRIVSDGEEALDYLYHRGEFSAAEKAPRPDLVLLDLNMPKVDGRQVLEKIKDDEALKAIPVVVLTTSREQQDLVRSYQLGCNSFLNKPVEIHDFIDALQRLGLYWFKLVVLPPKE